jgi:cytochrome c oxidase assembly protein subunit 15
MGAAAVRWPTSAEVMATHFGISLVCLASAALVARVLIQREMSWGAFVSHSGVTSAFRLYAAATIVMSVVVAYAGAYVRHTESELACTSWPTCNGELIPTFDGPQGIQTIHRLSALVISLMVVGMLAWTWKLRDSRPDLLRLALGAFAIVIAQSLVGRTVVNSGLALMATLSHAGLMAILFVILCETTRSVWPARVHRQVESRNATVATPATGD